MTTGDGRVLVIAAHPDDPDFLAALDQNRRLVAGLHQDWFDDFFHALLGFARPGLSASPAALVSRRGKTAPGAYSGGPARSMSASMVPEAAALNSVRSVNSSSPFKSRLAASASL